MDAKQAAAYFDVGLLELEKYLQHSERDVLRRVVAFFGQAVALHPEVAPYRAALGFVFDAAGRPEEALVVLREAHRLDPQNEELEVLIATLLAESGAEDEALNAVGKAAERQQLDLASIRQELQAAGMPTDARTLIGDAFIHARNFLRSWLEDEIDRAKRSKAPEESKRRDEAELRECQEMQDALEQSLDPQRVPAALRVATPWASRLGIGDDVCRGIVFVRLSVEDRAEVTQTVQEHASAIHEWLDGFGLEVMPPEAAAFMYLLLGVEETQQDV